MLAKACLLLGLLMTAPALSVAGVSGIPPDAGLEAVQDCLPSPVVDLIASAARSARAQGDLALVQSCVGADHALNIRHDCLPEPVVDLVARAAGAVGAGGLELVPDHQRAVVELVQDCIPTDGALSIVPAVDRGSADGAEQEPRLLLQAACTPGLDRRIARVGYDLYAREGAWWDPFPHLWTSVDFYQVDIWSYNFQVAGKCLPGARAFGPHLVRTYYIRLT